MKGMKGMQVMKSMKGKHNLHKTLKTNKSNKKTNKRMSALSRAEVRRNPLAMDRTNTPAHPTDVGQRTMTESNAPWAQRALYA